jgi:hypothetical protein
MNARQRIAQLEKQTPKTQSNYKKSIEVNDTIGGIIRDVRWAALARGELEPMGEALKAELLRVIDAAQTKGIYKP